MKTKPVLGDAEVKAVLAAAESHAKSKGWAVCIAVADDGGHLLGLLRLDGAAPAAARIAPAKAHAAALGRRPTKGYEDMINGGRFSFLSAPLDGGLLEGGEPIMANGQCIGAVGVSGVKANEDAETALAGIAALGL